MSRTSGSGAALGRNRAASRRPILQIRASGLPLQQLRPGDPSSRQPRDMHDGTARVRATVGWQRTGRGRLFDHDQHRSVLGLELCDAVTPRSPRPSPHHHAPHTGRDTSRNRSGVQAAGGSDECRADGLQSRGDGVPCSYAVDSTHMVPIIPVIVDVLRPVYGAGVRALLTRRPFLCHAWIAAPR